MMQCNANLPSGGMSEVHDMDVMHQSDSGVLQCSLFHDSWMCATWAGQRK